MPLFGKKLFGLLTYSAKHSVFTKWKSEKLLKRLKPNPDVLNESFLLEAVISVLVCHIWFWRPENVSHSWTKEGIFLTAAFANRKLFDVISSVCWQHEQLDAHQLLKWLTSVHPIQSFHPSEFFTQLLDDKEVDAVISNQVLLLLFTSVKQ